MYTKASASYSSPLTNFIVAVTVISPADASEDTVAYPFESKLMSLLSADHVTLPSTAFSSKRFALNLICS